MYPANLRDKTDDAGCSGHGFLPEKVACSLGLRAIHHAKTQVSGEP